MNDQLDEIVKEFLVESYENLDQLDRDLVALEEVPDDRNCLSRVFRTIHTIKGTSGFLAFNKLQQVTHVGENLLVPLRDGDLRLNGAIADSLLAMVDAVRGILRNIENIGAEGDDDYTALIDTLEQLRSGETQPAVHSGSMVQPAIDVEQVLIELRPSNAAAPVVSAILPPFDPDQACDEVVAPVQAVKRSRKPAASKKSKPKATAKSVTGTKRSRKTTSKSAASPASPASSLEQFDPNNERNEATEAADIQVSVDRLTNASSSSPASTMPAETHDDGPLRQSTPSHQRVMAPAEAESGERASVSDSTVRIDVQVLDKLMNLVGELVLARNQILQFGQASSDPAVAAASQRLNLITTELQEGVMKTRMQPIRNAWSKLPRVVRDLSQACGKQVQVHMEGADTELDKTILEAIRDPLTHIVRNSVDHGIETPAEREAAGKSPEGILALRAFHEGGHVIVEIADDGSGIRVDRVRAKAIDKGLISAEQAATMTDRELTQLILLPGFSTASQVTNVSGRGVGMDVVKTNVEKIGGTLDIQSSRGQGTTLRIKIPLTLAIVPALVVTCDSDRYCIPQVSLLELVRLEGERARTEIELLHSVPVYRLRGQLLPLVYLDEELGLRAKRTAEERASDEVVNIVVLQAEEHQFGLVVERINDTQEIVVKPLGPHLKGIGTYAGSTIMGDGAVALILDVLGLAQRARVLSEHANLGLKDAVTLRTDPQSLRQSYLVVDPGDGTRAAILLSSVARLEKISRQSIERCGHEDVVQYRGQIMPLVCLGNSVEADTAETISLVVFNGQTHPVGIVVGSVIDIVDEQFDPGQTVKLETTILGGRVTRLVDVAELAQRAG